MSLTLNGEQTALLVMDCQNDLIHIDGKLSQAEAFEDIEQRKVLGNINRLIAIARAQGMLVIFVRHAYRPGYPELPPGVEKFEAVKRVGALVDGSWGAATVDVLDWRSDEDIEIVKTRMSSFHAFPLDTLLKSNGINALICAGYSTHNVVEATVRQAVDLDYACYVISETCAAVSKILHATAINHSLPEYAQVTDIESVAAAL
jgi:biuret amidohydrolase